VKKLLLGLVILVVLICACGRGGAGDRHVRTDGASRGRSDAGASHSCSRALHRQALWHQRRGA
jgi:hypothetical protein